MLNTSGALKARKSAPARPETGHFRQISNTRDKGPVAAIDAPARDAASLPLTREDPQRDPQRLDLCATSPLMVEVQSLVARLAPTDVTVTILGETGTGKDVLAHVLHGESARAGRPFVVFDCGAVPPNLVESELFGHEKGSFTGAFAEHPGAFERTDGGTLFLDEIGELPLELQPRLLRVLDNRVVRRVGGTRDHRIDIRIIAATNRELSALVAAKHFRQDLYFRLAGAVIQLPALRDRRADVPGLVSRLMHDLGRRDVNVPDETLAQLAAHDWPGNIREMKNVLACALAFVDGAELLPRHLRFLSMTNDPTALDRLPLGGQTLESLERAAIEQTLIQNRGNKVHTARSLGIAQSTLYEKLKRYGL
jgi:DNA-binding NtrC family response regulator